MEVPSPLDKGVIDAKFSGDSEIPATSDDAGMLIHAQLVESHAYLDRLG